MSANIVNVLRERECIVCMTNYDLETHRAMSLHPATARHLVCISCLHELVAEAARSSSSASAPSFSCPLCRLACTLANAQEDERMKSRLQQEAAGPTIAITPAQLDNGETLNQLKFVNEDAEEAAYPEASKILQGLPFVGLKKNQMDFKTLIRVFMNVSKKYEHLPPVVRRAIERLSYVFQDREKKYAARSETPEDLDVYETFCLEMIRQGMFEYGARLLRKENVSQGVQLIVLMILKGMSETAHLADGPLRFEWEKRVETSKLGPDLYALLQTFTDSKETGLRSTCMLLLQGLAECKAFAKQLMTLDQNIIMSVARAPELYRDARALMLFSVIVIHRDIDKAKFCRHLLDVGAVELAIEWKEKTLVLLQEHRIEHTESVARHFMAANDVLSTVLDVLRANCVSKKQLARFAANAVQLMAIIDNDAEFDDLHINFMISFIHCVLRGPDDPISDLTGDPTPFHATPQCAAMRNLLVSEKVPALLAQQLRKHSTAKSLDIKIACRILLAMRLTVLVAKEVDSAKQMLKHGLAVALITCIRSIATRGGRHSVTIPPDESVPGFTEFGLMMNSMIVMNKSIRDVADVCSYMRQNAAALLI